MLVSNISSMEIIHPPVFSRYLTHEKWKQKIFCEAYLRHKNSCRQNYLLIWSYYKCHYCPSRCCVQEWDSLCRTLYVTESMCSGVRRWPPCGGVARCRSYSVGGHGGGSTVLLQPHCGTHGSLELQPLWWFPHVQWQAPPLRGSRPPLRGQTSWVWLVLWVDCSAL